MNRVCRPRPRTFSCALSRRSSVRLEERLLYVRTDSTTSHASKKQMSMLSLPIDVSALLASQVDSVTSVLAWLGTAKELWNSELRLCYVYLLKKMRRMCSFRLHECMDNLDWFLAPETSFRCTPTGFSAVVYSHSMILAKDLVRYVSLSRALGRQAREIQLEVSEGYFDSSGSIASIVEALSGRNGCLWSDVRRFGLSAGPRYIVGVLDQLCGVIASGALKRLEGLYLDAYAHSYRRAPICGSGAIVLSKAIGSGFLAGLECLGLGGNDICSTGMQVFASVSGSLPKIRKLYLNSNMVGDDGGIALFKAIGGGSLASLEFLNLDSNGIGDRGMEALVLVSGSLPKLHTLSLDDNNVGYVNNGGVIAISDAIQNGSLAALQVLILSSNYIYDSYAAMYKLFRAVAKLKHLRVLSLADNNIGYQGARAISNAISGCSLAFEIALAGNEIGDEGVMLMRRTIDDEGLAVRVDIVNEFIATQEGDA